MFSVLKYTAKDGFVEFEYKFPDGEMDYEYFDKLGFSIGGCEIQTIRGREVGTSIQVHYSKYENNEWFALVDVDDPETRGLVAIFVPSFPDFLSLLKQLEPMRAFAWSEFMNDALTDLSDAIEKMFHAWHGHYLHQSCRHCNPVEFERQYEWSRRQREKLEQ